MSDLVVSGATVHTPYITGWTERASEADYRATYDGFRELGGAFRDAEIDVLIVITSEHVVNLQPHLAPAFTVAVGDAHPVLPEPHFNLAGGSLPGSREFALALVRGLYAHGFDPAHSVDLTLDHGTVLPIRLMELPESIGIVPIMINTLFHPLPTLARCRAFGESIARIIAEMSGGKRVGVLATGGMSHRVGRAGMEINDPAFDRKFVDALLAGSLDEACDYSDAFIEEIGNGTHEIRNWITAAAAAGGKLPRLVTAIPYAQGWNTGVFQLLWDAA